MIPLFFVATLFLPLFPRRVFASRILGEKRKLHSERQESKVFADYNARKSGRLFFSNSIKSFLQHHRESQETSWSI